MFLFYVNAIPPDHPVLPPSFPARVPPDLEVCHARCPGGPFRATSDSRTTSVGALAIMRFLRPGCYQNLPDRLLPAALRQDNPYGVARRIDGVLTQIGRAHV